MTEPQRNWLDEFRKSMQSEDLAFLTMARAAKNYGVHANTLAAHLADGGTTWSDEISRERHRRFVDMTSERRILSAPNYIDRLGFGSPHSFTRWFREQFGERFTVWRRRENGDPLIRKQVYAKSKPIPTHQARAIIKAMPAWRSGGEVTAGEVAGELGKSVSCATSVLRSMAEDHEAECIKRGSKHFYRARRSLLSRRLVSCDNGVRIGLQHPPVFHMERPHG